MAVVENVAKRKATVKSEGSQNEPKDKRYRGVVGDFYINHLQNSLSNKCESLLKYQKRVLKRLETLLEKMSQK